MSDITTIWNSLTGKGDWQILNGSLESGSELATAVLISLFTDRRAQPSDVIPDGTKDPRGWWGDVGADGNIDEWGSRLWLLDRSIAPTTEVLNSAKTYCKEALDWMVTDGIAASIDIVTQWNANNFLAIQVTINQGTGTNPLIMQFQLLWNEVIV